MHRKTLGKTRLAMIARGTFEAIFCSDSEEQNRYNTLSPTAFLTHITWSIKLDCPVHDDKNPGIFFIPSGIKIL